MFEANVAMSILFFVFWINSSKFSQICFSETDRHFLLAQSESQIYSFTHSAQILAIFAKSAGLSIAGVWSILKSAESKINHFGVWMAIANVSGMLWFTGTNSNVKHHNFKMSVSGSMILYLSFSASFGFSKVFLMIHRLNGVVYIVGNPNSGNISLSAPI
jgi:hypothetical protein